MHENHISDGASGKATAVQEERKNVEKKKQQAEKGRQQQTV
jgi:hypothetical protein